MIIIKLDLVVGLEVAIFNEWLIPTNGRLYH